MSALLGRPTVVSALLAVSVIAWPGSGPSPRRRRQLMRDLGLIDPPGGAAGVAGGVGVGRGLHGGEADAWQGGDPFVPEHGHLFPLTSWAGWWPAQHVRRLLGRGPAVANGPALEREILGLVEGLAAALRAGLSPARAMRHLGTGALAVTAAAGAPGDGGRAVGGSAVGEMRRLVAILAEQAEAGARLEPVWRAAAERSRSPALTAIAEGWGLSERHGAPVVPVLDALVAALRDGARVAAAVESSLAAPRATAALLGVLPLGGVILGELVGVHPLAVLFGTSLGRIALCGGLIASLGGRWWMARLVRAAETH